MHNHNLPTVALSTRRIHRDVASEAAHRKLAREFGAHPVAWLGAPSPFGLALPQAHPTASHLYAPRGVWMDDQRLIVCDSGNHRVLIWNCVPDRDEQPADVVLGQASFFNEGAAQGCGNFMSGLHLPTGVIVADGKLLVADAWHHRILVWHHIPTESNTPADYAIGQPSLDQVLPNQGNALPSARSLYWPYGLAYIDGRLYVADTGNRRVLAWKGIPGVDQPAMLILGQATEDQADENRGGAANGRSFRWPHAIAGDARQLWIADAGNHRILGWRGHPESDGDAEWVLGQRDMESNTENPYQPSGASTLRFPYGLAQVGNRLIAADTANNRVLVWGLPVEQDAYSTASGVIGQTSFEQNGENRWQSVSHDSLCWPYGVAAWGQRVAIADSGNNRVMLWDFDIGG